MKQKTVTLLLLSFSTLALAACQVPPRLEEAQYWQRKDTTSALYLRGPKAQQALHKDIADCVTEIDELERLAPLRKSIPADTRNGQVPDSESAEGKLAKWDTPKRDGYLYAEHFNYTDFEGCMVYKGWERIESLPYVQADRARDDYLENVYGYKYQTDHSTPTDKETNTNPYASTPDVAINN